MSPAWHVAFATTAHVALCINSTSMCVWIVTQSLPCNSKPVLMLCSADPGHLCCLLSCASQGSPITLTLRVFSVSSVSNDAAFSVYLTCAVSFVQYGTIHQIIIPRPGAPSGVGKVILNFGDVTSAMAAQRVMNGRKFAGRTVIATFMTDDQLAAGSLD